MQAKKVNEPACDPPWCKLGLSHKTTLRQRHSSSFCVRPWFNPKVKLDDGVGAVENLPRGLAIDERPGPTATTASKRAVADGKFARCRAQASYRAGESFERKRKLSEIGVLVGLEVQGGKVEFEVVVFHSV